MTDRIAHMDAQDISNMIEYIVKYDTGNKTVGNIRKELGLTREEYDELYDLSMPAIRCINEGRFWKNAYRGLEVGIMNAIAGKKSIGDKLDEVGKIIKRKSLRILKEEYAKGMSA